MGRRVNVMVDDEAWEPIGGLPRGQRSGCISRAVLNEALQERRRRAAAELAVLRESMPAPPEERGRDDPGPPGQLLTRILVPDASVILKWVLPPKHEADVPAAVEILDLFIDGELSVAVPALWYFEVGNTITRLVPAEAEKYLRRLCTLGMAEIPVLPEMERQALSLVQHFGVAFYDAAYHALLLELGGLMVTADRRYRTRVSGAPCVVELADFRLGA